MSDIQNIEFKAKDHLISPSSKVIEIWRGGVFVAAIYPHKDGLRIVSKYMTGVVKEEEPVLHDLAWLPSAIVKLGQEVVSGS